VCVAPLSWARISIHVCTFAEIVQLIAQQWAKVDPLERKKLESEYRSDVETYSLIRKKYEEAITATQREEIQQLKLVDKETKEKIVLRKVRFILRLVS
jgi:hypothetical protein